MKRENSILQKALRFAEELKVFEIGDILVRLPEGKEKTIKRYLQAMVKNGNLEKRDGNPCFKKGRLKYQILYRFVSNKPIKTKIGE